MTPEAIRAEIVRYFAEPSLRERCVREIRKEKERLSWKGFADRLLEFARGLGTALNGGAPGQKK